MPGQVLPLVQPGDFNAAPKYKDIIPGEAFQAPIARALAGYMAAPQPTSSVDDISAMMSAPVMDPITGAFGGAGMADAAEKAYAGRISTVNALTNMLKERTAASRAPAQTVQDLTDAMLKTQEAGHKKMQAETEAFKLTPEFTRIQGLQELYKKMGETHGQLAANAEYTRGLDAIPLPPELQSLTGLKSYNDIRLLTGSDSAQAISGFVQALSRIKAAGIGAGGQVAAADKYATQSLVQTLNIQRQLTSGEISRLSKEVSSPLMMDPRRANEKGQKMEELNFQRQRLATIDQLLTSLAGTLSGKVSAGPAPTPAPAASPSPGQPRPRPGSQAQPQKQTVKIQGVGEVPLNADGTVTINGKKYRLPGGK